MTQVIEALIYAAVTRREEINSVVISKDVIAKMGQDIQDGILGDLFTFESISESVDCVCRNRIVQTLRYSPQLYLAGIPITISSCDNTCYIVLNSGNKIELTSHIEEECEEEITFEVEDLERIWYGGF